MQIKPLNISIIGLGNVGHHFAIQLFKAGYNIHQVCSRNEHAVKTAEQCYAQLCSDVSELDGEADVYIFCVQDDKIAEATLHTNVSGKLFLHTSASADTVPVFTDNTFGVLYPLQTFSRNIEMSFKEIPFFIAAENENSLLTIRQIASSLSNQVYDVSDQERLGLHVAAVFANNFSNYMLLAASEICKSNNLNFDVLKPLIQQTMERALQHNPAEVQTGPAMRGDSKTIARHLQYLHQHHPQWEDLYQLITHRIIEMNKI